MDTFVKVDHPEWTNLSIYPKIGELEQLIGLLNDLGEAFKIENVSVKFKCKSEFKTFIRSRLTDSFFTEYGTMNLVYSDSFLGYISVDILITKQQKFCALKEVKWLDYFIYFSDII